MRILQIAHGFPPDQIAGTELYCEALSRYLLARGHEERLRELARTMPVRFHGVYRPADLQTFDLDIAVFASITSESYSFALDEALHLIGMLSRPLSGFMGKGA
jgi:hypothetical protein